MTKAPQRRRGGMNLTQASLSRPASTRVRGPVKPPIVDGALAEPPATMGILLAEDSAVYRHLISGHLNDWGFDLVVAKDGERGVDVSPGTGCSEAGSSRLGSPTG